MNGIRRLVLFVGIPLTISIIYALSYPDHVGQFKTDEGLEYDVGYIGGQLFIYSGVCYGAYWWIKKLINKKEVKRES